MNPAAIHTESRERTASRIRASVEDAGYARRIFAAARELYDETRELASMNQIAARAKVGKGTVYRTFPSRDELLSAIAVDQLREVHALASGILAAVAIRRMLRSPGSSTRCSATTGAMGCIYRCSGPASRRPCESRWAAPASRSERCCAGARGVGAVRDDVTEDDLYSATRWSRYLSEFRCDARRTGRFRSSRSVGASCTWYHFDAVG